MKTLLLNFFGALLIFLPRLNYAQQPESKANGLLLVDFKATLLNEQVQVEWKTMSEANCKEFVIERASEDGVYSAIGSVKAHGNAYDSYNYSLVDAQPTEGINYYRVKIRLINSDDYSSVVYVNFKAVKEEPVISPNPSANGTFAVQLHSKEMSTLKLFTRTGKLVYQTQSQPGEKTINLGSLGLSAGLYYCVIETGGDVFRKSVVIGN